MSDHAAEVARYYDANTARFLRFGDGSQGGAIHRGLWLPDVKDPHEATDVINRMLIERLQGQLPAGTGRILELGCGVGATMIRLAQALGAEVTGITISRAQAEIAERRFASLGLADRCRVICADFARLPEGQTYHAIFGVEAFIHSADAQALLGQIAQHLEPGGRLLLCDDWRTERDASSAARERCLARFRVGWRVGDLQTPASLRAMGERVGLRVVEDMDLTQYLWLGRPRDRLIAVVSSVAHRLPGVVSLPFWGNLIGGSALQTALSRRWLEYRLIVLERAAG